LNLKPSLNLDLKTLQKRNGKGIRKSREKEKKKAAQTSPARPSQAACPRCLTSEPRLSTAVPLSRTRSLSRSLPAGTNLSAPVFFTRALPLSLCLVGPDRQSPSRCPARSFSSLSLCALDPPCQFRPLRARRGPERAHSRTSPDFSATTHAHTPNSLLRAPLVPRACPSPHFAQLHPLSRSAHAGDPRPRSRPSSSPETAPSLPELCPEVRHPSLCPIFPIALCARPISPSPVLGRGGPPCSRGGRPI
jgi:hypothetical protein